MRSYRHQVPATRRKAEWLRQGLFADYSAAANALSAMLASQWLRYFEALDRDIRPKPLMSSVPEHIKAIAGATVAQQAYANSAWPAHLSRIGAIVNDVRADINDLRESDDAPDTDTLKKLYQLNKSRRWLDAGSGLDERWKAWLADTFRRHWNRRGIPRFGSNIVYLDQRNCKVRESRTRHFERWARITHRKSGFDFPIKANPYADGNHGQTRGLYRVRYDADKDRIEVDLIKSLDFKDAQQDYAGDSDLERELALDFGLVSLFTTHEGKHYGAGLLDYLKRLDARIQRIQAECQRRKWPLSRSRRYRRLVRRMREHITCRVNETLNRIVREEKPSIIIVERLDFREAVLSRRMNRLVQNCGRAAVRRKLTLLQESLGMDFVEVNPAYTSQACSQCGYVDKKNRPDRDRFRCLWCGHEDCADANAAANIRTRRSWPEWLHHARRRTVLKLLVNGFLERHQGVLASSPERVERLRGNPYYRDALDAEVAKNGGVETRPRDGVSTSKCK